MNLQTTKASLLAKCIEQQQTAINQFQYEIEEAQKQANDYGQPKDRYDAFRNKLMHQIELFAGQLDKANIALNTLHKISLKNQQTLIEFGALVITNKQNIFISVGMGKIEMDGKLYYAVSPNVPIYKVLKGKQKGEELLFNNMKLIIEDVY